MAQGIGPGHWFKISDHSFRSWIFDRGSWSKILVQDQGLKTSHRRSPIEDSQKPFSQHDLEGGSFLLSPDLGSLRNVDFHMVWSFLLETLRFPMHFRALAGTPNPDLGENSLPPILLIKSSIEDFLKILYRKLPIEDFQPPDLEYPR